MSLGALKSFRKCLRDWLGGVRTTSPDLLTIICCCVRYMSVYHMPNSLMMDTGRAVPGLGGSPPWKAVAGPNLQMVASLGRLIASRKVCVVPAPAC